VTAPKIVIFAPSAQINPEFSTSLFTIRPPLPVASSVPALITTFDPVSMMRALAPVATIVPSLTSVKLPVTPPPGTAGPNCAVPTS